MSEVVGSPEVQEPSVWGLHQVTFSYLEMAFRQAQRENHTQQQALYPDSDAKAEFVLTHGNGSVGASLIMRTTFHDLVSYDVRYWLNAGATYQRKSLPTLKISTEPSGQDGVGVIYATENGFYSRADNIYHARLAALLAANVFAGRAEKPMYLSQEDFLDFDSPDAHNDFVAEVLARFSGAYLAEELNPALTHHIEATGGKDWLLADLSPEAIIGLNPETASTM